MADKRTIKIWKNPYGAGFNTTSARQITFEKGITVLVGCNGAGKTTLLRNIETELESNTPLWFYSSNDETDRVFDSSVSTGNWELAATAKTSSEGENITIALGEHMLGIKTFIATGKKPEKNPFARAMKKISSINDDNNSLVSDERWLLFDTVDSGYSIDNIVELKSVFELMLKDAKDHNIDLYIIISTNAYEFANSENCLDVTSGKHIKFGSYEDYKSFILKTKNIKENRYNKTTTKGK